MNDKGKTPCQKAQELLDLAQYPTETRKNMAIVDAFYLGAIAGMQALGYAVHQTDGRRHVVTAEEAL